MVASLCTPVWVQVSCVACLWGVWNWCRFGCRVKELTVDPSTVVESSSRPNIHAVSQLDLMDEEWDISNSPQRDDLKLLCERNVRPKRLQSLFFSKLSLTEKKNIVCGGHTEQFGLFWQRVVLFGKGEIPKTKCWHHSFFFFLVVFLHYTC